MLNNDEDSRKRKRKQLVETAASTLVNLQSFPGNGVVNGQSKNQEILNMIAPFKSFTALLTEADYGGLTANVKDQSDQVDQIINTHRENMRRELASMWQNNYNALHHAAEERVAKKLKEQEIEMHLMAEKLRDQEMQLIAKGHQNEELEGMMLHYRTQAEILAEKLRRSENVVASQMAALRTALSAPRFEGGQEADAESSFVDPSRHTNVKLGCKICQIRLATVMLWPCRHICICTRCETAGTSSCPVCRTLTTTSVQCYLPHN